MTTKLIVLEVLAEVVAIYSVLSACIVCMHVVILLHFKIITIIIRRSSCYVESCIEGNNAVPVPHLNIVPPIMENSFLRMVNTCSTMVPKRLAPLVLSTTFGIGGDVNVVRLVIREIFLNLKDDRYLNIVNVVNVLIHNGCIVNLIIGVKRAEMDYKMEVITRLVEIFGIIVFQLVLIVRARHVSKMVMLSIFVLVRNFTILPALIVTHHIIYSIVAPSMASMPCIEP